MKYEIDDHLDPGLELDEVSEDLEVPDTEPAGPGALSDDDVRRRSELATHLRPSIFPARRDVLVECAREEGADPELLGALEQLPDDVEFHTTEEVWEAFGRGHEVRVVQPPEPAEPETAAPEPPAPEPSAEPAAPAVEHFEFRFDRLHRSEVHLGRAASGTGAKRQQQHREQNGADERQVGELRQAAAADAHERRRGANQQSDRNALAVADEQEYVAQRIGTRHHGREPDRSRSTRKDCCTP